MTRILHQTRQILDGTNPYAASNPLVIPQPQRTHERHHYTEKNIEIDRPGTDPLMCVAPMGFMVPLIF